MLDQMNTQSERKAIEAELVKAYFKDAGVLNLAGSLVFLLLIFVVHDATPLWTWAPAVAFLLLVSWYRAYHIRQYRRTPERRDSRQSLVDHPRLGLLVGGLRGPGSSCKGGPALGQPARPVPGTNDGYERHSQRFETDDGW